MRPSLQLKMGQQLTMTPQLQQAIRLLQLSSLELHQEIQEALDSNPLLDAEDESLNHEKSEQSIEDVLGETEGQNKTTDDDTDWAQEEINTTEALQTETISEEMSTDTTWDDYMSAAPASSGPAYEGEDTVYQGETTDNIQDHLRWQLNLSTFTEQDLAIATAIIDGVDEKGFLRLTAEDIVEAIDIEDVEIEEVEAVLKRIQLFDPVGVACRGLQECLSVQLKQFSNDTPWKFEAIDVIDNYIDLLANRDYRTLLRKTKLKEPDLKDILELIQQLNPNPASVVIKDEIDYVIPDVTVVKKKGRWLVELNPNSMPKLKINEQYASLSKTSKNTSDTQFVRSHLQEAKWFIKSLESRNDTLLKVSNCIVQQQQGFFEYGPEAMKPMVLNDVAEMVDMHESTISRVTTQKYMHTPRGIFELKYFFSSHVSTENGGECSSTAIRALIRKLVAAENQAKPLSDSKIAEILADQGIQVARRTIAKYRESLNIPPSNQRKRLV
ncbi:RNA polymerase factor sigma-54 [Psychrosphaera sp. B3R10]|uniref:RNA polymerase factor sigma-54 n=1 Tax=unclassified Psychrosphaera TaxID=2641570 RepID=UPI001C09E69B|nr:MULTISPECIES: RNA polymerase factor sigma-54 [unclassified Psychrosphaera]MBU2881922.1 RNA polymerase factor sigma-54 [Psychrosphaera sp. I2R16]MBU2991233.1 RNA polymerase factor sigma-54 [Psychrosphaera sp. B3R10]MDO6721001.1 RNA polymerase factor sigma-54 [Psychrosphaera sp. 1_MG-2023]